MIRETVIVLILGIMLLIINERITLNQKRTLEQINNLNISIANISSIMQEDMKDTNKRLTELSVELISKTNEIKMLKK